jgi:hypothetical protein
MVEKEYIERESALDYIDNGDGTPIQKLFAYLCVFSTPAADVAEVRHGEWLPDYETFVDEWEKESEPIQTGWVCSLCGRQEFQQEPYCNCGAQMDGKGEN